MKSSSLLITAILVLGTVLLPVVHATAAAGSSAADGSASWVWPLPPDPPRIRFLQSFATPQDLGVSKGFFAKLWEFIAGSDTVDRIVAPHGVVSDGEGHVYVADWGGGLVHAFNFARKKYDQFSRTKKGDLVSPIGAALDGDGLLYISDSALRRVFVFDGDKNKRVIGSDDLLRPTGLAIDKKRKILYVVDTTAHRVDVFTLAGDLLRTIGKRGDGDGDFNYPTHIALDANGQVYVMDTLNFRVQIFDADGKFVTAFGRNGSSIGDFVKPKGIAVDSEGHIWVSDSLRDCIQVFDRSGKLLLIFGRKGSGVGEFNIPAGLFIDSKDRLFVADSYNGRIQMFQYLKEGK